MSHAARRASPRSPWTVALYIYCALVFAFLMLPMLIVALLSFSSSPYLVFPPPGFSLRWYAAYFGDSIWIDATIRSVKVGLATTVGATVLGTLLAFSLVRGRYPGRAIVDQLAVAPRRSGRARWPARRAAGQTPGPQSPADPRPCRTVPG